MENDILVNYYSDLYKNLDVPDSSKTLWLTTKPVLNIKKWFKNEEDLEEYFKGELAKRKEFVDLLMKKEDVSDIDFLDTLLPNIARYDYLGDFFGEKDVLLKSVLIYTEAGFIPSYVSIITKSSNNNLKMLRKLDDDYVWHDYVKVNELNEVYEEFEKFEKEASVSKKYTFKK